MLTSLAAPLASAAHAADHAALTLASSVSPSRGMDRFIEALSSNIELTVVFGVGGTIALFAIFFGTITSAARTKEREKTKRELAAYVAEGSITADDAKRLLEERSSDKC